MNNKITKIIIKWLGYGPSQFLPPNPYTVGRVESQRSTKVNSGVPLWRAFLISSIGAKNGALVQILASCWIRSVNSATGISRPVATDLMTSEYCVREKEMCEFNTS